jgi:flagellar basal body P-ring formation protein FlgA
MSKTSVKNSTPMHKILQILCLTFFCHLPMHAAWAAEQDSPLLNMTNQVRKWLSQTHRVDAASVEIAELDSRIKVQNCDSALRVDHPFASTETVRVKCASPLWQLYLQVNLNAHWTSSSPSKDPSRAVVPRQLIARGTTLKPDMLVEANVNLGQADSTLLRSIKDAENGEAVRDLTAGEPLRSTDLRRAVLVRMGQQVSMTIGEKNSFQVTVQLEALQDGRMGEQVKLKNTESGRSIAGVVIGPNLVKGL